MPSYAGIDVNVRTVNEALRRLPDRMNARARDALRNSGIGFVREMNSRFGRGDGQLRVRTGFLRRSIGYQVTGDRFDNLAVRVFVAGPIYANLQEYGGTIRPKPPRKFLTIPLKDNLTGAGVARYPSAAALRDAEPGRTFIIKNKRGQLLIGYREGSPVRERFFVSRKQRRDPDAPRLPREKTRVNWLWVLVPEVTVPARLQFRSTWEKLASARRDELVKQLALGIREVGL